MQQEPPVEHDFPVTLNQVVTGFSKEINLTRKIIDRQGSETSEKYSLSIDFKPGTQPGTVISFPKSGDQKPGTIPADIHFLVSWEPHEHFTVSGASDIEYIAKISKNQFLNGDRITIPSLDKQSITFFLDVITNPKAVKKFTKRGLPFSDDPSKRGNLLLKFELQDEPKLKPVPKPKPEIAAKMSAQNSQKVESVPIAQIPQKPIIPTKSKIQEILAQRRNQIKPDILPKQPDIPLKPPKLPILQKPNLEASKTMLEQLKSKFQEDSPKTNPFSFSNIKPTTSRQNSQPFETPIKLNPFDTLSPKLQSFLQNNLDTLSRPPPTVLKPKPGFLSKPNLPPKLPQDPPIERDLFLTLENILKGCSKRLKIKRSKIGLNGTTIFEDQIITIKVLPGTEAETRFTFPQLGNEKPGHIPADLIFIAHDQPNSTFRRVGHQDIECEITVTSDSVKKCCLIQVPNLESREVSFQLDEGIKSGSWRFIENHGLPFVVDPSKRGNLRIQFKVTPSFETGNIKF